MSTLIWPPISDTALREEQCSVLQRELEWLLVSLQETLKVLKAGLEDCANLVAPQEPDITTLVLSTHRTESLKGFITLAGARVIKSDIHLRLPSLPIPRGASTFKLSASTQAAAPTITVEQLTSTRTLINSCLDVVDATRWTGEASNASYMSSQLRLLHENVQDARNALAGGADIVRPWWEGPVDARAFEPPLPSNVAVHLSIVDAALVLHVRTLEAAPIGGTDTPGSSNTTGSYSGLGLRDRLVLALRGERTSTHDEADEVFTYRGKTVKVVDKVMVESQHPSLMAVMAKLSALDHTVALSRRALDVLMNADDDG